MRSTARLFVFPLLAFSFVRAGRAQESGAQPAAKIEPRSQPAVDALRGVARTIRECPEVLEGEASWGKRSTEIMRVYMGAPTSVIWGVDESKTPVRSPYTGYIEFSVSRYYWVPPDARDKFKDAYGWASINSGHFGDLSFRYEYDVGPDGVELSRSIVKGSTGALARPNWRDNPQGGKELWVDAPKELCWDKAARNPPVPAPPTAEANSPRNAMAAGKQVSVRSEGEPPVQKFELWGGSTDREKLFLYQGWTNGFLYQRGGVVPELTSCLASTSPDQAVAMIEKHYRAHPDNWSRPLGEQIIEALTMAGGPCESEIHARVPK